MCLRARARMCVSFVEQVTLIEIESKSINEANKNFCVLFTQCDFYQQQEKKAQRMSKRMRKSRKTATATQVSQITH